MLRGQFLTLAQALTRQHSRPDPALLDTALFAAKRWRAGCRGPRWAETAFLPTANAPTGRVGRGLDRRRDRRDAGGRVRSASHLAERGPTASARRAAQPRSPRN